MWQAVTTYTIRPPAAGVMPRGAGATQVLVLISLLVVEAVAALVVVELVAAGRLSTAKWPEPVCSTYSIILSRADSALCMGTNCLRVSGSVRTRKAIRTLTTSAASRPARSPTSSLLTSTLIPHPLPDRWDIAIR
jgi:hypothetical protein